LLVKFSEIKQVCWNSGWYLNWDNTQLHFRLSASTLFCGLQVKLAKGDFTVHPLSVYKTLEELWDGEI
jgi:hypothetical protein